MVILHFSSVKKVKGSSIRDTRAGAADPSLQAVGPRDKPLPRLWLSLASTKLYCLVTEAHV